MFNSLTNCQTVFHREARNFKISHLLFSIWVFRFVFITTTLVGVKWYLIAVLIYISEGAYITLNLLGSHEKVQVGKQYDLTYV